MSARGPESAPVGSDEAIDVLFDGRVRLIQSRRGFRTSVDSLALAVFACGDGGAPPATVLDLGAGSGFLAVLAGRCWPTARLVLVERDAVLAERAARNLALNGLAARATVHCCDAADLAALGVTADVVLCNPPFFVPGHTVAPAHPERRAAHSESTLSLEGFAIAAAAALAPGGSAAFVYPTDRADRLVQALGCAGLGDLVVHKLQHRTGDGHAVRVLVRAGPGSLQARDGAGLAMHPAGALDSVWSDRFAAFLRRL